MTETEAAAQEELRQIVEELPGVSKQEEGAAERNLDGGEEEESTPVDGIPLKRPRG